MKTKKRPGIVGKYIREQRERLRLSQRALGQLFEPSVTTQFVSNLERGVTPLPPAHIPTLARALEVSEGEILSVLEREYAMKLSGNMQESAGETQLLVAPADHGFMKSLYEAYVRSDERTRQAFHAFCENLLDVRIRPLKATRVEEEKTEILNTLTAEESVTSNA